MKEPNKTLAGDITDISEELLARIVAEYKDIIIKEDYDVLVQSCKKLMETSVKIRITEITRGAVTEPSFVINHLQNGKE